jgi:hypothetical protein
MPPKHRQLHAPCPTASGNVFQALVDPPNDGNNLSFDGGDGNTDRSDDTTAVNAPPRGSGPPASPKHPTTASRHSAMAPGSPGLRPGQLPNGRGDTIRSATDSRSFCCYTHAADALWKPQHSDACQRGQTQLQNRRESDRTPSQPILALR